MRDAPPDYPLAADTSEPEACLAAVAMEERMPAPLLPPGVVWVATRYCAGFESVSIAGVQMQRLLRKRINTRAETRSAYHRNQKNNHQS